MLLNLQMASLRGGCEKLTAAAPARIMSSAAQQIVRCAAGALVIIAYVDNALGDCSHAI
jgi:hypothetical protein